MTRIQWASLPDELIEDMVAVLLSSIHGARHIDGKGGDGGRDVQIELPEGIHAFEIKSFTGRITSGRRAQVRASLHRASALDPISWTLIVPIDPTPAELTWFDGLRSGVPFPLEWKGLSWLDRELATQPAIARYFLKDLKDELVDLAVLLGQEEAALVGGGPDVMERARKLVERANELDPFYRFEVTSDGKKSSIKIIPRYPGAERDRPITGAFTLAFPKDEAGRAAADDFQRALDFGTGVKVPREYLREASLDAPASLGGQLDVASVEVMPSTPPGDGREMLLAVVEPSGSTIVEVPIVLQIKTWGLRGSVLEGIDRTGLLSVQATVDVAEGAFRIQLSMTARPFLAAEIRPLTRLLAALCKPNTLALRAADGSNIGHSALESEDPLVPPYLPQLIEDLALIQWAAGMSRKVGPELSLPDVTAIAIGVALLRGERIETSWKRVRITLSENAPPEIRRSMLAGEFPSVLRSSEPHVVTIEGVAYKLGRGMQLEIVAGKLYRPPAAWKGSGTIPDGAELTLIPASSDRAFATLVTG